MKFVFPTSTDWILLQYCLRYRSSNAKLLVGFMVRVGTQRPRRAWIHYFQKLMSVASYLKKS